MAETDTAAAPTRAGYVALVGFPNAGKSSLMNRLVEQKLSIVTPLAQTTRERVLGIDSRDGVQMVFVDTPGLVDPRYLLHRSMLHEALGTIDEADVVVLLVDAAQGPPALPEDVVARLAAKRPLLVVANKTDVASAGALARVRAWSEERFGQAPRETSATTGAGVEALRAAIAAALPESPFLYPDDELSAQPVRFFVAELVRETVFEQYQDEIPYAVAVKVEEFREAAEPLYIRATIFVERPTQKGILIGAGGAAIRRLGSAARAKIEAFVEAPVFLDLWVKVLPRWRRDPVSLQRLGFRLPGDDEER